MENKFSSGAWLAENSHGEWRIWSDADNEQFTSVVAVLSADMGKPEEEIKANAVLMAASKDLLAACNQALEYLKEYGYTEKDDHLGLFMAINKTQF